MAAVIAFLLGFAFGALLKGSFTINYNKIIQDKTERPIFQKVPDETEKMSDELNANQITAKIQEAMEVITSGEEN